ncbi:phosphotransferase family protein (plasmid) [Rhodococcus opacus]|uniref:Phosphotransferase n=2 Tax=Rhodococcus TaxID=1827 RepID=K8XRF6_RHOOP|nr:MULTISPECIES: phosphotransferase family protein [Rhodococcus]EKT83411.1 phosphotransferase [Rhodococcus opacus M213]ELB89428.1 phosphotransferase [Rhodococcus wratislaviensis IFP 2016]QSE87395.1 phosphotransferase family protein [Rhodococcus pseudokoreensis]WKN60004.1 phosphotransferase family protein [Rhodococcus opacus]
MTITAASQALDLWALERWLRPRGLPVTGPLAAQVVITGGRSNLTFFLTDQAGRRWVVRRPPLGAVLSTAHDVGREFRVMSALAGTAVPVPSMVGLGTDAHDVAFYVMSEVPGLVLRDGVATTTALLGKACAQAGEGLVDALVDDQGSLQAVLDWELCTRGDPMVDLGVFLYHWTEAHDPVTPFLDPPTILPGFHSRQDLLAHYVRVNLAYAAWRSAVDFEGVAGRSAAGAYGPPDAAEEHQLAVVTRGLIAHARDLLEKDGS